MLGHIKKLVGDHPFCFKEVGRAGFFLGGGAGMNVVKTCMNETGMNVVKTKISLKQQHECQIEYLTAVY